MRRSSRGNPWHDPNTGKFCTGPKGIYTNENNDGSVYVQFFSDAACTDEYDNHEITAEELQKNDNNIDKAIDSYLDLKKSEKTKEEYSKRSEERFNEERRKSGISKKEIQGKRRGAESYRNNGKGQYQKRELDGRTRNDLESHVWPFRDGYGFHECLERGRQNKKWGCCVDNHDAEDLDRMKLFLSDDNNYGIAVEKDGNICCAFNCGSTPNVVPTLLKIAKENGGTKMDCYGRVLVNMYEQNGFKPVARIPFNADYVDKTEFNKPLLENKFDVYALCLRKEGEPAHISTQQELDNLPTFEDYDEALNYRDKILSKI